VNLKGSLLIIFGCLFIFLGIFNVGATEENGTKHYVGSKVCGECHQSQYETFLKYAKKAHSYKSVEKMKKGLTPKEIKGCYRCHTTGYGEPGGFVSEEATPHLKNLGCETCHGPGSLHVESEDGEDIIAEVDVKSCSRCHNKERVAAFRYKPILHAGAH